METRRLVNELIRETRAEVIARIEVEISKIRYCPVDKEVVEYKRKLKIAIDKIKKCYKLPKEKFA